MTKWMLLWSLLTMQAAPLADREGLPDYYQPVIGAYETFHQQFQEPLEEEEPFVDAREIDRVRKGDLRYALYDLDDNEIPELLIADQEVFRILTFKEGEVINLAGYRQEAPLVDQVSLQIYQEGQVLIDQHLSEEADQIGLYQMNAQGDQLDRILGLTYDADQVDSVGQDMETKAPMTLKEFQDEVADQAGDPLDLADLDWHTIEVQDLAALEDRELEDWTTSQDAALANLITDWSSKLGQSYQAATPANNVPFYGPGVPQENFDLVLEGQVRSASYRGQAREGDLQILAVYTDLRDTHNPDPQRHLYLFVLDQGEPGVLVTTKGPNDQGLLTFQPAEDPDLQQGFKAIYQE